MTPSLLRRHPARLLSVVAALALALVLVGGASAETVTPTITISNLTPAPNSTVQAGVPTIIAANITSNIPIASVTVFLDGQRIDVEVAGRSETQQSFFTSRILSSGTHTVRAVVTGAGAGRAEALWSFTVGQATTTATVTATVPARLPVTGGFPVDSAVPALLALSAAATGIGLRLRAR